MVIQEEFAILWEMIVCVILSKKVHMNMGPIVNVYRDYGKKKLRTILRARTAIT
jgi:amino acid permease